MPEAPMLNSKTWSTIQQNKYIFHSFLIQYRRVVNFLPPEVGLCHFLISFFHFIHFPSSFRRQTAKSCFINRLRSTSDLPSALLLQDVIIHKRTCKKRDMRQHWSPRRLLQHLDNGTLQGWACCTTLLPRCEELLHLHMLGYLVIKM